MSTLNQNNNRLGKFQGDCGCSRLGLVLDRLAANRDGDAKRDDARSQPIALVDVKHQLRILGLELLQEVQDRCDMPAERADNLQGLSWDVDPLLDLPLEVDAVLVQLR